MSEKPDIAIIGMACRFPGARNVDEFWANLLDGKESISHLSEDELSLQVPAELRQDPLYVRAAGLIEKPFGLDAGFFGISPMEAKVTDPQHRVLLETAWHALEHAGEAGGERFGRTAVYAGVEDNSYYKSEIAPFPEAERKAGDIWLSTSNEKDYVAPKIAFKLNLRGPAISVQTACSTSLVATIMACRSLKEGDCDMALAGGASVHFPTPKGYYFQQGGTFSHDGRCRPFDKDADGTIFTDGVAVVVLKRLADALKDGNTVYAVIKGGAINNDGADRMSFTFPSIQGQTDCIAAALRNANVDAGTIQYVEAHGTATPIGDPIELDGLRQAYATRSDPSRLQYCGIGSVKSNIGHTEAAAGVASLIKTALALHHGVLPPTINFREPNPKLRLEESPFYIADTRRDWPAGQHVRRAGVSSFGFGGTNSHVILEEAPALVQPSVSAANTRPFEIWPVSAKSAPQRDALVASLLTEAQLPRDVAFTLQHGRGKFRFRGAQVRIPGHPAELKILPPKPAATQSPSIALMFPGQGSQYIEMGRSLHDQIPEFRDMFSKCCDILSGYVGVDFKTFMFDASQADTLENTRYTQPALFAIEASLGRLLLDWGVRPDVMVGHSVGEFAAAYLAGIFTLEDALKLVATRGRMVSEMPRGRMISARGSVEAVLQAAGEAVDVASINAPANCVLSGPDAQITRVQSRLEAAGIPCRPLHTSHAFHSAMMEPVVEAFEQIVRSVKLAAPKLPIISTVTGERLTDQQATDPGYWARHLRATVKFSPALLRTIAEGSRVFIEVGPRATLSTLASQHFATAEGGENCVSMATLGDEPGVVSELGGLGTALAKAWCAGVEMDWSRIWPAGRRVPLQSVYPFERKNFRFSEGLAPELRAVPAQVASQPASARADASAAVEEKTAAPVSIEQGLLAELTALCSGLAGTRIEQPDATFVECGLDSLVLMQLGTELGKRYGVSVGLRKLMGDLNSLALLSKYVVGAAAPARLAHLSGAANATA